MAMCTTRATWTELAAHLAVCAEHPHRRIEVITREWTATGDPTRAACAAEIETALRDVWLRPPDERLGMSAAKRTE